MPMAMWKSMEIHRSYEECVRIEGKNPGHVHFLEMYVDVMCICDVYIIDKEHVFKGITSGSTCLGDVGIWYEEPCAFHVRPSDVSNKRSAQQRCPNMKFPQ